MGTEDLACGPTMLQVRFSPNLEQGERKERGEIVIAKPADLGTRESEGNTSRSSRGSWRVEV